MLVGEAAGGSNSAAGMTRCVNGLPIMGEWNPGPPMARCGVVRPFRKYLRFAAYHPGYVFLMSTLLRVGP